MKSRLRILTLAAFFGLFLGIHEACGRDGSARADAPGYWIDNSVIVAEVVQVIENSEYLRARIRLRPLATLSGSFDCGKQPEVEARTQIGGQHTFIRQRPDPGAYVIAVLTTTTDEYDPFLIEPEGNVLYTPDESDGHRQHANLVEIRSLADPVIATTLESIRKLRKKSQVLADAEHQQEQPEPTYWSTHSLVYGTVEGRSLSGDRSGAATIDFRPSLRLSGEFDPGLVAKVTAGVDLKKLAVPPTAVPASGNAIILLVRDRDSYAVASERPDFMPGGHFPICAVNDFSDPKVLVTLKAVQESRSNEKPFGLREYLSRRSGDH